MLRRNWPWLIAAVIAVAIGVAIGFVTDDNSSSSARAHTTIDVELPGPDQKVTVDRDNQLDRDEQREDKALDPRNTSQPPAGTVLEPIDLHEDTRDETPAGVTKEQVEAGREKAAQTEAPKLADPAEPAGAQAYSCPHNHVVNQSALNTRRYGVALHFTVSNPGSLRAIWGMFNRPSFGASSNLGFELFNLKCEWWVPIGKKAWAQGAFNSPYVSIEIITNDRSRASWLSTPAFKYGVLAALVRDLLKQTGAPAKLVDPAGCAPLAGVTDHDRLECGNSHWDVGRNFPWDVFMRQVRQGTTSRTASVLAKPERKAASRRCYHRSKHLQANGGPADAAHKRHARYWIRVIARQRSHLRDLGLTTKRNRKLRHRVLGGYATGKACPRR